MTPTEAAALLAYASAADNRTVTREAAILWAETIDRHATMDEARAAVASHFANSTEYLTPAHVNARIRAVRSVRSRELPPVTPPHALADHPTLEARWIREWGDAMIVGHSEADARTIANQRLGVADDYRATLDATTMIALPPGWATLTRATTTEETP